MDFMQEETAMLIEDGYTPGFMMDIQENDLVAIAPVTRTDFDGNVKPVKTLVVKRLMRNDASYFHPDNDKVIPHTVINFIGWNLDNLPEHCAYGNTYPCFYKRELQ